jgi:general secretion pathway protein D
MRFFMKKSVRLVGLILLILLLVNQPSHFYAGAMQQQPQPGPGKKFVVTPFGPIEVDISDPRPGIAFGPPLQPEPAAPAAVQPPAAPVQPGAAQTPPAGPQPQGDQSVNVQLNFNNADLHQVVRLIGNILAINYVIDPTVRGSVNMNTAGNVRRSDLFGILEAILKMNGATMVKADNFYQIVPANTAVRMPLEVQNAQPGVAPDDQIVLQIVAMKFVASEEMAKLLTPYISEAGNIVAQGSVLLITDRRSNLRKLLEVIDVFDTRAFQGERVRILPIKNNRVKDVVDDLKTVFSGYALSTNTAIRFLPIERMNSVLVVTPNPDVFTEVERWLDRLDQPIQTAGLRNYVYRAKNAKALDIQRVLLELYATDVIVQTPQPVAPPPTTSNPPVAVNPAGPNGMANTSPAAPNAQPATGFVSARLGGQLRIVADPINNALVIQATPQDYQTLERTIQELDVLPRQVLIDAQIYEVNLDHSLSLGLSAILQNKGTLAADQKVPNAQTTASFAAATGLQATTFAFVGRTRELVAFLNASENRGRIRTLSAPSILVSNNATASVQIGAEIPVPTSSAASGAQQNGSTLFAQTIQFRDTGVILGVTPQINEGGNVTLVIAQEVSQATANTTSAINAPVIGKSAVRSTIVVQNGETIPLTGFMRDSDSLTRNRVPLLGTIPVAGWLFGNTSKSNTRSEIIVLITPHVVSTVDERAAAAEELKAKLKETQRLIN